MKHKTLTVEIRKQKGKGPARRLRMMGKIPAVIYGHSESKSIAIDEHEFNNKFKNISESTIIKLVTEKENYNVLVKDFQENALLGKIMHIDFFEVEEGKLLRTHVPIHMKGTSIGVKHGGILERLLHEMEVECLPKDLPHEIVIDITDLEEGHSIHVSDVTPLENVRFLNSPDQVICLVEVKAAEVVEAEEEGVEVPEEEAGKEEEAASAVDADTKEE
jgi:large subunit ribosomal protein L25